MHVGLVEGNQLMGKELMIREQQRKYSFCEEQVQNGLTSNGEYFLDTDGVLYRKEKLVVPQSLIQEVITENHDSIFVAHPGSKSTF